MYASRFLIFAYATLRLTLHQVRDQQTSAALGLPPRIRDEDCQVADLEAADFEESKPMGPPEIFRTPPEVHIPYVIGMAQLARLCTIPWNNRVAFADSFISSARNSLQPVSTWSIQVGQ
jgi:hypothetical protein